MVIRQGSTFNRRPRKKFLRAKRRSNRIDKNGNTAIITSIFSSPPTAGAGSGTTSLRIAAIRKRKNESKANNITVENKKKRMRLSCHSSLMGVGNNTNDIMKKSHNKIFIVGTSTNMTSKNKKDHEDNHVLFFRKEGA